MRMLDADCDYKRLAVNVWWQSQSLRYSPSVSLYRRPSFTYCSPGQFPFMIGKTVWRFALNRAFGFSTPLLSAPVLFHWSIPHSTFSQTSRTRAWCTSIQGTITRCRCLAAVAEPSVLTFDVLVLEDELHAAALFFREIAWLPVQEAERWVLVRCQTVQIRCQHDASLKEGRGRDASIASPVRVLLDSGRASSREVS